MKAMPTVSKYMTTLPHTVGAEQNLTKADQMMAEFKVRHLPVLSGGKLIGVISERDIRLAESFRDVNPESVTVGEACSSNPFIVAPETSLADACAEMAARKYGCALVCDHHILIGIFTWVDALNAFGDQLRTRLKP